MKCIECGCDIPDGSLFCNICGHKQDRTLEEGQNTVRTLESVSRSRRRQNKAQEMVDENGSVATINSSTYPSQTITPNTTAASTIGFSLLSSDDTFVNLECKRCKKVYKYRRLEYFIEVTDKFCIPNTLIRCPNCCNQAIANSKTIADSPISFGKDDSKTDVENKEEKKSSYGCLRLLLIVFMISVLISSIVALSMGEFVSSFFLTTFLACFTVVSIVVFLIYAWVIDDTPPEVTKERNQREKYSDYRYTCPQCGSNHIKRIGNLSRDLSITFWGLASGKIGKQYECDNCKHMW